MKEKIKQFLLLFATRGWLLRTLWVFIACDLVYMVWDSWKLGQYNGVGGYFVALMWFSLYVATQSQVDMYRKFYRTAMDGWKSALDGYERFAKEVNSVTEAAKEAAKVEEKPLPARKGRTLGSR